MNPGIAIGGTPGAGGRVGGIVIESQSPGADGVDELMRFKEDHPMYYNEYHDGRGSAGAAGAGAGSYRKDGFNTRDFVHDEIFVGNEYELGLEGSRDSSKGGLGVFSGQYEFGSYDGNPFLKGLGRKETPGASAVSGRGNAAAGKGKAGFVRYDY